MADMLMNEALLARGVVYIPCVDSTNLAAKQLAGAGAPHGTVVLADEQTSGRGRRGRSWLSRPGVGAWMTIITRPPVPTERAPELVLVVAVALCEALGGLVGSGVRIKWPNDVLLFGKKISGTLLEMSADDQGLPCAVVGVGINILGTEFPPDLPDAASIESATGVAWSRSAVVESFLDAFDRQYAAWIDGGMARILPVYRKHSATLGQRVRAICPGGDREGIAEDIAEDGALLLRDDGGALRPLYAGDVSIRSAGMKG